MSSKRSCATCTDMHIHHMQQFPDSMNEIQAVHVHSLRTGALLDGCSHPGLVLQQCAVHNLRLNNLRLAPQVEVLVDLVRVQVGGEMAGSSTVGEWGAVRGMGPGDENEIIRV